MGLQVSTAAPQLALKRRLFCIYNASKNLFQAVRRPSGAPHLGSHPPSGLKSPRNGHLYVFWPFESAAGENFPVFLLKNTIPKGISPISCTDPKKNRLRRTHKNPPTPLIRKVGAIRGGILINRGILKGVL